MSLELYTTITRIDADGDPVECDATVYFSAKCTSPGYAPSWDDPVGAGAEYECTFDSAEIETRFCPVPGKLTDAELETLRTWFLANDSSAHEAANDNFADDPGFDNRGFRGLEA